ncbi:MAG TPA: alpha/beta hydrolase [Rubrivivax sp.]|nr:alpha/beta hydrolase [Rubrivivax sp.]
MRPHSRHLAHDVRGAARLATDATMGLTDLVEAMHARITRVPGWPVDEPERTGGITGLVYQSVRGVTRLVGGSLDALLGLLAPELDRLALPQAHSPEREAVLAALNGVLGDYLVATSNPLAATMSLRRDGLPIEPGAPTTGRLLVLVHGLCMNDRQWLRDGHDHGAALARDAGYTPVYVHYNTGQHVSINGRALAALLDPLVQTWPQSLERVAIVGHSMGGLVARSAVHQARQAGLHWAAQLSDMVFLGTPHQGAALERAGNWLDAILGATPYAAPFARLGKVRSAGITDLRRGNLLDEDWVGRDRFALSPDRRQIVPLPEGVRCAAVAASLTREPGGRRERFIGDGLVPLPSALGQHADPARALAFAPDLQCTVQGVGHLGLLSDAAVYDRLRRWLA